MPGRAATAAHPTCRLSQTEQFFECCEKASGTKSKGDNDGEAGGYEANADPKKSGIPKGDEAKEEAKRKEEQQAMDELLKEYGSDALRTTFWRFVKFDDPDTIMLRFLRARKWDVSRATAMLAGCLKWRLDNTVEQLAEQGDLGNGPKVEKFLDQQRSGKTYAMGAALNEQPICYIHVRKHLTFGQPGSSMQKYVIYAMESFRLLMMPPNDKVTLLFDLTGFGLRNMDWSCILFIVKCLEAYFPESLGILYIHNAPWIFSGIWRILSPLLDPVVRSKVKFTKGPLDMTDRIPAERLVSDLGGEMTNEFVFLEPEEGENELLKDTAEREKRFNAYMDLAREYEEVTGQWASKEDAAVVERRLVLVKKLRVAQFHMEPYTRGKTVCHRDGTLDGQGIVTWLYKQKSGEPIRHIVGRRHCVAVMKRELKETEEGSSLADAEAKSEKAVKAEDWTTLYGSEELAKKIEGVRTQGKIPDEGTISPQTKEAGGVSDAAKLTVAYADGAAPAGGAVAAATAVPDTPAKNEFADAPEAKEADTVKAVDGDAKVDAKADTAEGGGAEDKPAAAVAPANGQAAQAPNGETQTNGKGVVGSIKDKKEDLAAKSQNNTLGRRFSKLLGRSN